MTNTVKKRVSELTGAALDYAVAMADPCIKLAHHKNHQLHQTILPYSTDWEYGGPLVDKYGIWITPPIPDCMCWVAEIFTETAIVGSHEGDSALPAICRAVVMAKLGQEIELPVILFGDAP